MPAHRIGLSIVSLLLVGVLGGCTSDDRLKVYPVHGLVFVKGQPAEGARVMLHPAADPANPRGLHPFAIVAADGSFRVSTYVAEDGAPPGDYVVTIFWPRPGQGEDAPDQLKNAYADPRAAKLRVTVQPARNELEPFQLP